MDYKKYWIIKQISFIVTLISTPVFMFCGFAMFYAGANEGNILLAIIGMVVFALGILICKKYRQKYVKPKENGESTAQKALNKVDGFFDKAFQTTYVCRVCKKVISKNAKRCPNCGEPTPREVFSQITLGIVFAPLIGILGIICIGAYLGWFSFIFR